MIPVKIISKVDIPPIEETVIANLIKAEILRNHPELYITNISFERRLSPQRMEAIVEAELATTAHAKKTDKVQEEMDLFDITETPEVSLEEDEPTSAEPAPEDKPKRKKVFN